MSVRVPEHDLLKVALPVDVAVFILQRSKTNYKNGFVLHTSVAGFCDWVSMAVPLFDQL